MKYSYSVKRCARTILASTSPAFFRRAQLCMLTAFTQGGVSEVVVDGATGRQVGDDIEAQTRGFNRRGGCRYPAWPPLKKSLGVGVAKVIDSIPLFFN